MVQELLFTTLNSGYIYTIKQLVPVFVCLFAPSYLLQFCMSGADILYACSGAHGAGSYNKKNYYLQGGDFTKEPVDI